MMFWFLWAFSRACLIVVFLIAEDLMRNYRVHVQLFIENEKRKHTAKKKKNNKKQTNTAHISV